MWLRQSTASQEILLGPFLDDTDGKTAETGLTIAATDIKIWVEGVTTEADKNSGGGTHIAAGRYSAVLDATDTATLGKMEINVHVAGALPVRRQFMVLPAVVYDSLVLGTDVIQVDVTEITAAACNKIADHSRRRTQVNVEASSDGDALDYGSLYGLIQQGQESNTEDSPGNLRVYRTDGSTVLATRPITTDATADPVTGIS